MAYQLFSYLLMGAYILLTLYLSYVGMQKTKNLKGFAIGNKDMSPILIGITMAASIASAATFVINPGFVYNHGLSAYIHYGFSASLGVTVAFLLLSRKFRAKGAALGSLTIPHFIRQRFQSKWLALFFAMMNLLSITFIVLILVGSSLVLGGLFGLSQHTSLILILLFVFSYVIMGGTYAHAYTNTFQGIMMMVISLILFFSGWQYLQGGLFENMAKVSTDFASFINPSSNLYNSFFSVFISGFLITFSLMFQPHIFTKILYIKDDKDVNTFIITTIIVGIIFTLMLFIGFYARFAGLEIPYQDAVVQQYILYLFGGHAWGKYLLAIIFISLLAAGMSTLDGILVSLSAMVINDIYFPLVGEKNYSPEKGLILSRLVLVAIGLLSLALAWSPPKLVGLFAQKGVYGLAAATFAPILFGILSEKNVPTWVVAASAIIGFAGHFILNLGFSVTNPAVSSSIAIIISFIFTGVCWYFLAKEEQPISPA